MTFEELEDKLSNGFHDAKIERILVDYPAGTLRMSMKVLTGTPGEPDEENDGPIELIVGGLYFFSVELPDPTYQFKPNGKPLEVQGGKPELYVDSNE